MNNNYIIGLANAFFPQNLESNRWSPRASFVFPFFMFMWCLFMCLNMCGHACVQLYMKRPQMNARNHYGPLFPLNFRGRQIQTYSIWLVSLASLYAHPIYTRFGGYELPQSWLDGMHFNHQGISQLTWFLKTKSTILFPPWSDGLSNEEKALGNYLFIVA